MPSIICHHNIVTFQSFEFPLVLVQYIHSSNYLVLDKLLTTPDPICCKRLEAEPEVGGHIEGRREPRFSADPTLEAGFGMLLLC